VERSSLGKKLVTVASAKELAADLAKHRTRLGFLRADEVSASVRALAWGSSALFGVGRVGTLGGWELTAPLEVQEGSAPAYDPATSWTLVAGGDILLDRGVSLAIGGAKAGADFPFNGGTVAITGHCKDCSPMGWDLPYTKRTGNAGVVRDLIKGADIAIANFENPAPDRWRWHGKGMVFSANPKHIAGLADAGIDWVSLANNHIGDAGRAGIVSTQGNLDDYGIKHAGAGRNTADAHRASLIEAGGVTVGILGYDTIASYYHSGTSTPGSAKMTRAFLKKDIAAARKAGADLVIVFPHWGVEYRAKPTAGQRNLAHLAIDAGADLVIGNHPHWVGGMELYKGKPIWYALGNFVFDQTWSEPTMEGITLELTFRGTEMVQARMRPHLIMGKAQPNFMDPMGSGKVVMNQLWGASKGLLGW
jgi:poly-gamma-glutamate capsule biosynthesis protein CapA/YwtB (metallophosphatase superfamily)